MEVSIELAQLVLNLFPKFAVGMPEIAAAQVSAVSESAPQKNPGGYAPGTMGKLCQVRNQQWQSEKVNCKMRCNVVNVRSYTEDQSRSSFIALQITVNWHLTIRY